MDTTDSPQSRQQQAEPHKSDHMAKADVANGERPEQPESGDHSTYERRRTHEHPVGDEQAETNRAEDSPS
jgi:hypothetical protein